MQTPLACCVCKDDSRIVTDSESGEIICGNCGIVISDKMQENNRPEWRTFSPEEVDHRCRTGSPTSLTHHDMGLFTIIAKTDKDANGREINATLRSTMNRLRTLDFRTQFHTATDRNLKQAFDELSIWKDKLALSSAIIENSAYLYRKVQQIGFVRGRTITAVLAAVVYIVCREIGCPKTLKDIALVSNIKRKDLAKAYRQLVRKFDFEVPNTDPLNCIPRVANKANLSERTKRQAIDIMNKVTRVGISAGKDPMGLAASVLYLSCIKTGEDKKQVDISRAAGVTDITLRNRLKDLRTQLTRHS
jgi:transcription initiation factor TFIIB